MAEQMYLEFLKSDNPDLRRREVIAFIGPNPTKFLPVYDEMRESANRLPGEKVGYSFWRGRLCGPAFLLGPVWFFYRKLWLWGAGLVAVQIVLVLIPGTARLGLPFALAMGWAGHRAYVTHAITTIARLQALDHAAGAPTTEERIAAVGGVSKKAGWIAGVIYFLLAAAAIASISVGARPE